MVIEVSGIFWSVRMDVIIGIINIAVIYYIGGLITFLILVYSKHFKQKVDKPLFLTYIHLYPFILIYALITIKKRK